MRRLSLLLGLAACRGRDEPIALRFSSSAGDRPAVCGQWLDGLGASGTRATPTFSSFFVHGLELRDPDGAWVPAALTPGPTASETVALVDLAGSGCALADPGLADTVRATAPPGPFDAVRFRLGVPEDQNHLDLAELEPPLDEPGMWWSWLYGFVFLRLDLALEDGRGWGVHVGATGCDGDPDAGFSCTNGNLATIEVEGFDPDADVLDLDLRELLGDSDLTAAADDADGCLSGPEDGDCAAPFAALGLSFQGIDPGRQTAFRAAP